MSVLLWSVISCEEDSQYATGETYYKYETPMTFTSRPRE